MDFLDVPTVLQISAAFNLMAAVAWLTLAQLFRMAPRASRLMAASHLVRVLLQGFSDSMTDWPVLLRLALSEYGLLASVVLLLLALRRMLGSRLRQRQIAWVSGLGAVGIAAGLCSGSTIAPQAASMLTMALLAVLAMREIFRGVGGRLSAVIAGCTMLPFAAMALFGLAHAVRLVLVGGTESSHHVVNDTLPDPLRAVLGFLVTASITLSLIALLIWRLVSRIQHLTYRDPLTGALNRRAFQQALTQAQAQLLRGRDFALVMIDIDHFKKINDAHGHPAGDAALRHCVRIWQASLRGVDSLGRLGGEEFCALLPLTVPRDLSTAAAVAERLRAQLADQPLQWQGVTLNLTASLGVALPAAGDAQGEVALVRADAELYRAKAEGRNRVCVATQLQSEASA